MKEYLSGTMLPEEAHAAEVHLSSCPLCSLAMEGFEEHSEQALHAIAALNSGFLKEHFDNISPQIHLNSMAPAAAMQMSGKRKGSVQPLWRVGSIAAAMLLLFGLVWAIERSRHHEPSPPHIAMNGGASGTTGGSNNGGTNQAATTPANSNNANSSAAGNNSSSPVNALSTTASQNASSAPAKAPASTGKDVATTSPSPARTTAANGSTTQQTSGSVASTTNNIPVSPSFVPDANAGTKKEVPATHSYADYDPDVNGTDEKKDIVPSTASKPAATPAKSDTDTKADRGRSNESYSTTAYQNRLNGALKQMASSDPRVRNEATINAAKCYAALGNKAKAEELLKVVIEIGSNAERREARKALRKLN
jgi:FimV-like protein